VQSIKKKISGRRRGKINQMERRGTIEHQKNRAWGGTGQGWKAGRLWKVVGQRSHSDVGQEGEKNVRTYTGTFRTATKEEEGRAGPHSGRNQSTQDNGGQLV